MNREGIFYNRQFTYTYDETLDIEYQGNDPNIQLFGFFECPECNAWWSSAYSWYGYTQQCKRCGTDVEPVKLTIKKIIIRAKFNCTYCSSKWKAYIYIISVDPEYIETSNWDENAFEERYNASTSNSDLVRYDIEPQQCYCGELVYPKILDNVCRDNHMTHLCSKCNEVGDCRRQSQTLELI